MKKLLLLIVLLFGVATLSGCGTSEYGELYKVQDETTDPDYYNEGEYKKYYIDLDNNTMTVVSKYSDGMGGYSMGYTTFNAVRTSLGYDEKGKLLEGQMIITNASGSRQWIYYNSTTGEWE